MTIGISVSASASARRAVELVLRAAEPVFDRVARASPSARAQAESTRTAGYRAVCRIVLRLIVLRVAERRGLPAELHAIDASPRAAWSDQLRECADALDQQVWLDPATAAEVDELLTESVEQVDRSLATLGLVHEHLLDHRPQRCATGWTLIQAGLARKRSGTFYTPPALARSTVDKTLGPLLVGRSTAAILDLRICDPALGGAVFSLAALDCLVAGSSASRRELAERCLFGVDLDPIAVELARLVIWLAVGDPELACDFMAPRLRHGNALIGLRDAIERDQADRECARSLDPNGTPSELAERWAMFHWSVEFPEVFARSSGGFDVLIGNPPWEIRKPSSREFFAEHDPDYLGRTKQGALARQTALLADDPELRAAWTDHHDRHQAFSRWIRQAFHHQGHADHNSYKLFVERAHVLLRPGGRLGMIVPSGLYADKGAAGLRSLLLDHGRWEWLFGFENRDGIFAIHRSFKFAVIVAGKGGTTESVRVAFMRRDIAEWALAEPVSLAYPRARIEQFSPHTRAIFEIDDRRDLELLERIDAHGVLLGDESERGWGIRYCREFDMTNDSHRFAPRPSWTARGYRPDEYGHWLAGDWRPIAAFGPSPSSSGRWSILERPANLLLARDGELAIELDGVRDVALPVYEGRMIDQYDFSAKGWVAGSGRSASWRAIGLADKQVEPQYLMAAHEHLRRREAGHRLALGIMDVSAATNSRTLIAALTHDRPHGNKVPLLFAAREADAIELLASLNSLTVDFALRQRLAGLTLNSFILAELPVAVRGSLSATQIPELLGLAAAHIGFARTWLAHRDPSRSWRSQWALTRAERVRRRVILDVVIATALGLDEAGLAWILRDCDHSFERGTAPPNHPKGFWRVDKHAPAQLRHPMLVRAAFHEASERGLADFLVMNEGQGWLPPEQLGERFHPWQLGEDVAASWQECERHALLIDALLHR